MSINLITGCMFSGKTSELINIAKINKMINRKVMSLNFLTSLSLTLTQPNKVY